MKKIYTTPTTLTVMTVGATVLSASESDKVGVSGLSGIIVTEEYGDASDGCSRSSIWDDDDE